MGMIQAAQLHPPTRPLSRVHSQLALTLVLLQNTAIQKNRGRR
jgi:hypothetical protein